VSGKFYRISLQSSTFMNERTSGYESVTRLSVYIGEFHPDAQMKGLSCCNLIALTFSNFSAKIVSSCFMKLQY